MERQYDRRATACCAKFDLCPDFGGSDYHGDKLDEHQPENAWGKAALITINLRKS